MSTSGCFEVQSLCSDNTCFHIADPKSSGGASTAAGNRDQRGAKVPETPIHVPITQLQLLGRYGVMCGEHQRVPILEAVPYVLRGVLLRYHKQLPLALWRLMCVQNIQEMQRSAETLYPASAGSKVSQIEHGEWPDECPWAHVQEVAEEMIKLCIATFNEVYCQSFTYRGLRCESGVPDALMSHEQVVERLQEISCTTGMCASMKLTDATVTYRNLTTGTGHTDRLARVMVRLNSLLPDIEYS